MMQQHRQLSGSGQDGPLLTVLEVLTVDEPPIEALATAGFIARVVSHDVAALSAGLVERPVPFRQSTLTKLVALQ